MAGNLLFHHLRRIRRSFGGVKVGRALKECIQVVQSAEDDIYGSCKIEVVTGMVDIFHQVPSVEYWID